MRLFALTEAGKIAAKRDSGDDEESRVLSFLRQEQTATDDELEVVGGESYVMRQLKERGLVKELTS